MTRRAQFVHARVVSVYDVNDGGELSGDHLSGSTITLVDASDFADDGGKLFINGEEVHDYLSVNYETNVITLSDTLVYPWADGTRVECYPLTPTRIAQVLTYDDDDEDFGEARVPHHYTAFMNIGQRLKKRNQESVVLIHDGQSWVVFDILGKRTKVTADHASAERTFRYTAEGLAGAGYTGVKIKGNDGTALAARAHVATAPTSTATISLMLNNSIVATFTILSGKKWSNTVTLTNVFDESDQWRVEHTDPKNCGANLVVYLYVTINVDDEDLS